MNIAVIGVGRVGSVLARRWAENGHQVTVGVRAERQANADELRATLGDMVRVLDVAEAVAGAAVVALAVPWEAVPGILKEAGDLQGKTIIDCTNPLVPGFAGLSTSADTSAGEQVAAWTPGAYVVKAFNTTGSANMANPSYPGGPLTMFVCGEHAEAKQTVTALAQELGFDVADAGGIRSARYLEYLAMLWIHLAFREGFGPNVGFHLERR